MPRKLVDAQSRSMLDADKAAKFDQLQKAISNLQIKTPEVRKWALADGMLCRYLRARQWDVEKALTMIQGTIKWREERRPWEIEYAGISSQVDALSSYLWGFDGEGHPIVYMRNARDPVGNADQKLDVIIHNLEDASRISQQFEAIFQGIEKVIYIIDLSGFTMANSRRDTIVAKKWTEILSNHCPESLHRAYLVNYPYIFKVFWGMVSGFIDPVTSKKVLWCSGDMRTYFTDEGFDMRWFEKDFGGDIEGPQFVNSTTSPLYKSFFSLIPQQNSPYCWSMLAAAAVITASAFVEPPPPRSVEDVILETEGESDANSVADSEESEEPPQPAHPTICLRRPAGDLVEIKVHQHSTAQIVIATNTPSYMAPNKVHLRANGQPLPTSTKLLEYSSSSIELELVEHDASCCTVQ